MLEIIEEEDEEGSVGLPSRAAESLASECSSDCGDLDNLTNPDQSAQNDRRWHFGKLFNLLLMVPREAPVQKHFLRPQNQNEGPPEQAPGPNVR